MSKYKIPKFTAVFTIAAILFVSGFLTVSAESGEYGRSYAAILHTPNICAVEFENEWVIESTVKEFTDQAKVSVQEWEVKLKGQELLRKNHHLWDIDYTLISLEQKDTFDFTKCDIVIQFKDKPDDPNEYYSVLGYAESLDDRTLITIYYAKIATCQTEDETYFYYDPCYLDFPRTPAQVGSIIRHELGHAFGLGHYYSESESVNLNWSTGKIPAPSVMVIFSAENAKLQQIRDIDIQKLHAIYGGHGFKSGKLFDIADSNLTSIQNTTNQNSTANTMIHFPDWMKKNAQSWAAGQADDQVIFGVVEYLQIQNILEYPQIPEGLVKPSQAIPQWYKNTADWWSQGLISDEEFINGLVFLLEKKILVV